MSWYAQSESTEDTLLVAIANLLKRYGQHYNASAIKQAITEQGIVNPHYGTLPFIYPDLAVEATGDANTWPTHNNAIVTFHYTDEAGVDHINHSLVTDPKNGRIADSIDGQEKSADRYGRPVSWVSYAFTQDVVTEEVPEATEATEATPSKTDNLYTLLDGETLWSIARRYNYEAKELAIHNDIEPTVDEMAKIQEGHTLHLPSSRKVQREPEVIYQFFDEAKIMHVTAKKGATKWSFGNAKTWDDIEKTGPTYKYGHVFKIVGVAQVPIQGEKLPAGYYIDAISAGDNYHTTNRPKLTTGFRWKHDLKAGLPTPQPIIPPVQDPPKPQPEEDYTPRPSWKEQLSEGWRPYETGAVMFKAKERTNAVYLDMTRDPKPIYMGRLLPIAGTFMYNGRQMGWIDEARNAGLLWFVDMKKMEEVLTETDEDSEIYETTASMDTKKLVFKNGRFSIEERIVAIPLSKLGRQRKTIIDVISKIKEKK